MVLFYERIHITIALIVAARIADVAMVNSLLGLSHAISESWMDVCFEYEWRYH